MHTDEPPLAPRRAHSWDHSWGLSLSRCPTGSKSQQLSKSRGCRSPRLQQVTLREHTALVSSVSRLLGKQKMVNKSTFGSSSYTSLSAFLFEVFNFASINPDCAFSFHTLRSKSPFFCKLPATHSHLVTLSSSSPQKDLGVKLPASLEADESACTSGKYATLFLPSTWIRPKTQTCTT